MKMRAWAQRIRGGGCYQGQVHPSYQITGQKLAIRQTSPVRPGVEICLTYVEFLKTLAWGQHSSWELGMEAHMEEARFQLREKSLPRLGSRRGSRLKLTSPVRDVLVRLPASGKGLDQSTFNSPLLPQSHDRNRLDPGGGHLGHPRTVYKITVKSQIWRPHKPLESDPGRDVPENNLPGAARFTLESRIPQSCICFQR